MNSPEEGPEWADEAHLDEVFSSWVPGPPAGASAAEREMAGDNPPLETPVDDPIADQDMDAALAAALAEAEEEGETPSFAPASHDADSFEGTETTDEPAWEIPAEDDVAQVGEPEPTPPHEPASPSWLDVPETPPAVAPAAVAPRPEPEPAVAPSVMEDGGDLDSAPADEHAFQPAPPPPAKVARPWTRTDDDILPGRRGKGRS